jgi:hypothetical protein
MKNTKMNIDDIVKKVRKNINKTIVENRQFLNEKWSYSSDVEEESDKIIGAIQQQFLNGESTKITNDIIIYIGEINGYLIFDNSITIHYYVYNCYNINAINFLYNGGGYYQSGYSETDKTLILTLYAINNDLQKGLTKKELVHEVEHIMQSFYGKINTEKYTKLVSDIYATANNVLQEPYNHSKIDSIIAKSIYYSNSHEQDAFMQEYYQELKNNRFLQITQNGETHAILKEYLSCYNFIVNKCSDNDLKDYKYYGITKNNLTKYISRQVQRFEKKMKNIEKHFPLNYNTIR